MLSDSFQVSIESRHGRTLVVVRGEIDMGSSRTFRKALLTAQEGSADVIVDFSNVTFLDSTGLKALIGAYQRTPKGGSLGVVGAPPAVRRVFEITGMSDILLVDPPSLTWQQLTYHNSGWRQWITEERTSDGAPVAEIVEFGVRGELDGRNASYALEHEEGTRLYGSLDEAMRAAELLGYIAPDAGT